MHSAPTACTCTRRAWQPGRPVLVSLQLRRCAEPGRPHAHRAGARRRRGAPASRAGLVPALRAGLLCGAPRDRAARTRLRAVRRRLHLRRQQPGRGGALARRAGAAHAGRVPRPPCALQARCRPAGRARGASLDPDLGRPRGGQRLRRRPRAGLERRRRASCAAAPPPTVPTSSTCRWRCRRRAHRCASTTASPGGGWPSSGRSTAASTAATTPAPIPSTMPAASSAPPPAPNWPIRRAACSAAPRRPGWRKGWRAARGAGSCSASRRRSAAPAATRPKAAASGPTAGTATRWRAGACCKACSTPACATWSRSAATCIATWRPICAPLPNDPASPVAASEFVTTSISSRGGSLASMQHMRRHNPDIAHARGDERGWTLIEVTPEAAQCEFRATAHPALADAVFAAQARFAVEAGRARGAGGLNGGGGAGPDEFALPRLRANRLLSDSAGRSLRVHDTVRRTRAAPAGGLKVPI